ncbi:hypothetical protein DOTSEDRAFT_69214 [Dothistroma septosporum NZE10]|uniref:Protein transport protein SEC22 n=1 Tax=Dothistroma septosporum (strain NZE10 / CBS 128990) TaxID=675120 RepID=N1PYA4_DOTSN|nr:hypothetical protein DOTSEDRAFT_69214 [Dothistroma septosporum NZE10]
MIYTTQIVRLDGLTLVGSVDDGQLQELPELKQHIRTIMKKINRNSEPRASIESDRNCIHYVLGDDLAYIAITERSYPKKLAVTYLEDIRNEFQSSYKRDDYLDPQLRPYAYSEFDRFLDKTKRTYQDSRATDNLGRLNDELKDVTQVMTKNIEDLLYRGDSLEKMGDMSSRLREDSAKYKRAAVRINWELLLKQYGPFAGLGLVILILLVWRFW